MNQETPDVSPGVEIVSDAHRRNLALYAREALARALTIKGITAGTHSIDITAANELRLELEPHEAHHLASILEEAGR